MTTYTIKLWDCAGQMSEFAFTGEYVDAFQIAETEMHKLYDAGDGGSVDCEIRNANGKVMDMMRIGVC